jgi:hypothetical protein
VDRKRLDAAVDEFLKDHARSIVVKQLESGFWRALQVTPGAPGLSTGGWETRAEAVEAITDAMGWAVPWLQGYLCVLVRAVVPSSGWRLKRRDPILTRDLLHEIELMAASGRIERWELLASATPTGRRVGLAVYQRKRHGRE